MNGEENLTPYGVAWRAEVPGRVVIPYAEDAEKWTDETYGVLGFTGEAVAVIPAGQPDPLDAFVMPLAELEGMTPAWERCEAAMIREAVRATVAPYGYAQVLQQLARCGGA
jgi:hypothetical protein